MESKVLGTYISTKGKELVDFLVHMGLAPDVAQQVYGSVWTLKFYRDGKLWGFYLKCREHPQFNLWHSFVIGEETSFNFESFGGCVKFICTPNSTHDGFHADIETEKWGKLVWESKFTDEGATMSITGKGKTSKAFWDRRVKFEGGYIFEHGENVEAYFKAIGQSDSIDHYKNYKLHVFENGNFYRISEFIGELGRFSNTMELDQESTFNVPGEEGVRGTLSMIGHGKLHLKCKHKNGLVEEWTSVFSKSGLVMTGVERRTGVTCTFVMRRFWEMIGSYKLVSVHGLESFGHALGGMTLQEGHEMAHDYSIRMIISDKGPGMWRYQIISKNHPTDITFRMNQEFTWYHPILRREVKMTPTMTDAGTLCLTSHSSLGRIMHKMYFNNEFCVESLSHPASHMRCKIIYERMHHSH